MYGGPQLRPYVVEFIRGTGVRVNGVVVQDSGGNGPFSWVLPDDVAVLQTAEVQAGGCGGQGGGDIASPLSLGGGTGGPSGNGHRYHDVIVRPGATLTVTIGAGGAGSAVNTNGGASGGSSYIEGVEVGWAFDDTNTRLYSTGNGMFRSVAGASASAVDTVGGGESTPGIDGSNNIGPRTQNLNFDFTMQSASDGAVGGGGRASGAAGGQGGGSQYGFGGTQTSLHNAAGTNAGGISRGGGGQGGYSRYGSGGHGGSNGAGSAPAATAYGAGGGGGAGGFAGGPGADGYARLLYWSAR
jgi:hypothetical protein